MVMEMGKRPADKCRAYLMGHQDLAGTYNPLAWAHCYRDVKKVVKLDLFVAEIRCLERPL